MTVHQNTKLFTNSQFSWHRYGCRQACVDHLLHVKSFIVPPVPHKVIMHFLVSINHKRINFNLIMCILYILSYTIIFIVFFLLSLIKMVLISMPNSYLSFFFFFFFSFFLFLHSFPRIPFPWLYPRMCTKTLFFSFFTYSQFPRQIYDQCRQAFGPLVALARVTKLQVQVTDHELIFFNI